MKKLTLAMIVCVAFAAVGTPRTVEAQGCHACYSAYDVQFNYTYHFFGPWGLDTFLCSGDGGCHGYAAPNACEVNHSTCSSYGQLKSPERAFEIVSLASTGGKDQQLRRLVAANKNALVVDSQRGVIQILDCARQIVGQVAISPRLLRALRHQSSALAES